MKFRIPFFSTAMDSHDYNGDIAGLTNCALKGQALPYEMLIMRLASRELDSIRPDPQPLIDSLVKWRVRDLAFAQGRAADFVAYARNPVLRRAVASKLADWSLPQESHDIQEIRAIASYLQLVFAQADSHSADQKHCGRKLARAARLLDAKGDLSGAFNVLAQAASTKGVEGYIIDPLVCRWLEMIEDTRRTDPQAAAQEVARVAMDDNCAILRPFAVDIMREMMSVPPRPIPGQMP